MDVQSMREATRETVREKFGRKRLLASKIVPHYPANLEREYVRVTDAYMEMFKNTLAGHLPNIRSLLKQSGVRTDAEDDTDASGQERATGPPRTGAEIAVFATALENELSRIFNDFAEKQGLFDLRKRVGKLASLTRKLKGNGVLAGILQHRFAVTHALASHPVNLTF